MTRVSAGRRDRQDAMNALLQQKCALIPLPPIYRFAYTAQIK